MTKQTKRAQVPLLIFPLPSSTKTLLIFWILWVQYYFRFTGNIQYLTTERPPNLGTQHSKCPSRSNRGSWVWVSTSTESRVTCLPSSAPPIRQLLNQKSPCPHSLLWRPPLLSHFKNLWLTLLSLTSIPPSPCWSLNVSFKILHCRDNALSLSFSLYVCVHERERNWF